MAFALLCNGATVSLANYAGAGDCHEGLLVRPVGSCTYPEADERFSVDDDRTGWFRLDAFTGSVDVDSRLDRRHYDLAASEIGNGVWRIDRVGSGTDGETVDGTHAPLVLDNLQCDGALSASGMDLRITGTIHALADVSSVTVTAQAASQFVDLLAIGRMSAGAWAPFVLQGSVSLNPAQFDCAVVVEYFDLRTLRRSPPFSVTLQGRASE